MQSNLVCMCLCGLTTQASSGHRCVIRSAVLQHHDAGAVIPLYADPARCVDQVHAACVFHIKRVTGEWKSSRSVVYCHLKTDGHTGTREPHYLHKISWIRNSSRSKLGKEIHLAIKSVDNYSVGGGSNVQLLETQSRCTTCRTLKGSEIRKCNDTR